MSKVRLLSIYLEPSAKELIKKVCSDSALEFIDTEAEFDQQMDRISSENFDCVVCGSTKGYESAIEIAQLVRQMCGSAPLLFASTSSDHLKPKELTKNGFSQVFFLPMDNSLLEDELKSLLLQFGRVTRQYKPVYIVDIDGESELQFPTYLFLPLNKKHVCFSKAKSKISNERIKKLESKEMGQLMIEKKDMDSFLKYSSQRLVNLGKDSSTLSETERKEKLQSSIRGLFSNLIDTSQAGNFEAGKDMLSNCQKIVSLYLTKGKQDNWHSQLIRSIRGANNSYDHAASVSTLASLFAIAIDHPHPEDLAMAGFLHDLGRAQFPDEMLLVPLEEWPEEQKQKYLNHPIESLNIIKTKKMVIPNAVEKAILQHHEMFNGKGFPKQTVGERICVEAQILSVADQVFYLTIEQEGKKRLSPLEAFEIIRTNGSIAPSLLRQLSVLFKGPQDKSEMPQAV